MEQWKQNQKIREQGLSGPGSFSPISNSPLITLSHCLSAQLSPQAAEAMSEYIPQGYYNRELPGAGSSSYQMKAVTKTIEVLI